MSAFGAFVSTCITSMVIWNKSCSYECRDARDYVGILTWTCAIIIEHLHRIWFILEILCACKHTVAVFADRGSFPKLNLYKHYTFTLLIIINKTNTPLTVHICLLRFAWSISAGGSYIILWAILQIPNQPQRTVSQESTVRTTVPLVFFRMSTASAWVTPSRQCPFTAMIWSPRFSLPSSMAAPCRGQRLVDQHVQTRDREPFTPFSQHWETQTKENKTQENKMFLFEHLLNINSTLAVFKMMNCGKKLCSLYNYCYSITSCEKPWQFIIVVSNLCARISYLNTLPV